MREPIRAVCVWAYCAPWFLIGHGFAHEVKKRQSQPVVCGQPLYTGAVSETAQAGTFVLRASASDTAGVPLVWSIPDTSLQRFSINPNTGDVSITAQLSRNARSALEFRIRASETSNAQNYCEAVVRINVLPVTATASSATSTLFAQSSYSFTVSSCVAGTTIGQVLGSTSTGATYTYSIPAGNSYFTVNSATGLITLSGIPPTGTQTFTVQATSSTGTTGTVPVTVTVSCTGTTTGTGSLIFAQPTYTFTQTSCTPGYPIGAVSAYSLTGGTVTYSLLAGNGLFTINPVTGQLSSLTTTSLGTQTLTVVATSSLGQTAITQVLVSSLCSGIGTGIGTGTVSFSQPYYTFTAATCIPGGTVGQIAAIANGLPVTYQVYPTNPYFSVNPTTGLITIIATPPAGLAQTLQVQALSLTGQSAIATVSITGCTGTTVGTTGSVFFQQPSYTFTATTCTPGIPIGQVFATSLTGGTVIYQSTSPYFTVNPTTGQITTLSVPPAGVQTLQVLALSSTGQTAATTVTISTLCSGVGGIGIGGIGTGGFGIGGIGIGMGMSQVPTFLQPLYTLTATTCTSGSQVGSVSAQSIYGTPIYSIDGGNPYFIINPSTGAVTLITQPPAGIPQSFIVRAQAAGYSASAPVSVIVSCTGATGSGGLSFGQTSYAYPVTSCTPGSQVGQVSAVSPLGGTVTYSLNGGNGQFSLNPTNGAITVGSQLNSGTSTTFTVLATSSTGQSGQATVTVTPNCGIPGIQPFSAGPNQPSAGSTLPFSQPSYSFTLSACAPGSILGSVSAAPQSGSSVTYSMSGTNNFGINPTTGQIGVLSVPSGTVTATVVATSSSGQSGTAIITVSNACSGSPQTASNVVPVGPGTGANLPQISSNVVPIGPGSGTNVIPTGTVSVPGGNGGPAPVFTQSNYQCSASCSTTNTQRLCVVRATNAQQDSMDYTMTPSNQFYIDPNNGEIRTEIPIRNGGAYLASVTATDPYGNTATASLAITITGSC